MKDEYISSVFSITILGIGLFFIWELVYSILVFQQIVWYKILIISTLFLFTLIILVRIFIPSFFKQKIEIGIFNIIYALLVFALLVGFSSIKGPVFTNYYPTFPLLEAELGLGWHKDSVFHVSIIQSIINHGYPSTGQHETPVIIYHVLSHYIDALFCILSNVEPYDAYGLLYQFKIFMLLSSIVLILSKILTKINPVIYLLLLFFLIPLFISDWSVIGSHGLWFTSVIVLLSSINVYSILAKKEKNIHFDYLFVFFLIILISLGKVSTGFMYAVFIGLYLFLKNPKSKWIYILGFLWIAWFYIYHKLMSASTNALSFELFNSIFIYLYQPLRISISLYLVISLIFILALLLKDKKIYIGFVSAFGSFCILLLIVVASGQMNVTDVFYFKYGLTSVLILYSLQLFMSNLKYLNIKISFLRRVLSVLTIFSILSYVFYSNENNIFHSDYKGPQARISNIVDSPFETINLAIEPSSKIYLGKKFDEQIKSDFKRPLLLFRMELDKTLLRENISKKNVLLYVPKDIFNKDFKQFHGISWGKGLLLYSIIGIPLIYGVDELISRFGFSYYSEKALFKNINELNFHSLCKTYPSKLIIETVKFYKPVFKLHDCRG
jgi:hypothetical protein